MQNQNNTGVIIPKGYVEICCGEINKHNDIHLIDPSTNGVVIIKGPHHETRYIRVLAENGWLLVEPLAPRPKPKEIDFDKILADKWDAFATGIMPSLRCLRWQNRS